MTKAKQTQATKTQTLFENTSGPADNRTYKENNKVKPEDRAGHDWYRFVLSFPPHLVREYVERFGLDANSRVLDPFCGTGTTQVECKKIGIPNTGIESHPMACFASRVKIDWELDPEELLNDARSVGERAQEKLETCAKYDKPDSLWTLPEETEKTLLKDSISPLPLHKTLVLLETIEENSERRFTDHARLALSKALVSDIGNLRFGPEVGLGKIKNDAEVIEPWLKNIEAMAKDITNLREKGTKSSSILRADSRFVDSFLKTNSIDAVITSPPYPNEKDYTRTTRLETVLLGFIRNREDLRAIKKTMVRSNTRGVYKADLDDELVSDNTEINRISKEIEERRIELGKTSGFERLYARVTKLYFGGMLKHLSGLREVLRPNAKLAYVVGDQASYLRIMIHTGKLLAGVAESLGYELIGIDLFRTRLATATKEKLREEVVLLKWPGTKH